MRLRFAIVPLIAAAVATFTGAAAATPALTLVAALERAPGGAEAVVRLRLNIAGAEYHGHPQPLTALALQFPAGLRADTAGFITCPLATLEPSGSGVCPSESFAGPASTAQMYIAFGGEIVPETATVQAYVGSGATINFLLAGRSPVSVEALLKGTLSPNESTRMDNLALAYPLIETVPGAPSTSTAFIELALSGAHLEAGLPVPLVALPLDARPTRLPGR